MRLQEWMDKNDVRISDLAKILGMGRSRLYQIVYKNAPMRALTAYKIILLTNREVTLEDLVSFEDGETAQPIPINIKIPKEFSEFIEKEKAAQAERAKPKEEVLDIPSKGIEAAKAAVRDARNQFGFQKRA